MQRRILLKLGIAGGAALTVMAGGTVLSYEHAWRNGHLTSVGRTVLGAVATAVLEGSLPADHHARDAALAAHLMRMESMLLAMVPAVQREVDDLLAILATPIGRLFLAGLRSAWPDAPVTQVQAALQSMRSSRITLRRQSYHALRDLTHAAYFADSGTWAQLGYPGPAKLG